MTQREPGPQQRTAHQWQAQLGAAQQWQAQLGAAQEWQVQEGTAQGGHPAGRVVPVPGAAASGPQPQWATGLATPEGWRPGPVSAQTSERTRAELPTPVIAASVLSLVVGGLMLLQGVSSLFDSDGHAAAVARLLFPATMVLGGVSALRGRRGWLTTGAVLLLLAGSVLAVELISSDGPDSPVVLIESVVWVLVGVLVIVLSRVPAATTYFETAEELRYGRAEAGFFR